jgi:hypothetical protein
MNRDDIRMINEAYTQATSRGDIDENCLYVAIDGTRGENECVANTCFADKDLGYFIKHAVKTANDSARQNNAPANYNEGDIYSALEAPEGVIELPFGENGTQYIIKNADKWFGMSAEETMEYINSEVEDPEEYINNALEYDASDLPGSAGADTRYRNDHEDEV